MLRVAVIQLTDKQIDALREFQRTRSLSLAVDILDNIIEDLGMNKDEKSIA